MKSDKIDEDKIQNLTLLVELLTAHRHVLNLDMECYHKTSEGHSVSTRMKNESLECGSSCCAIGFSAYWGIGLDDTDEKHYRVGFFEFSHSLYSFDHLCPQTIEISHKGESLKLWEYMFGVQNSNDVGALIKRIQSVIDDDRDYILANY